MIENRRGLTIFSHAMLIMGIMVILFPLYVAFVAATLDNKAVFETPMTLVPGSQLLENMKYIWVNGVGVNSAPFWLMMLNSFIMAFGITVGKITVSMLSAFAIVWFRFPLRNLFFWMIFITLMLPVEVRIFPTVEVIANLKMLDSYAGLTLPLMASATATFLFRQFFMTLPDELIEAAKTAAASGKYIMDYEADEAGNIFAGLSNASDPWYTVKNDAWVVNTNGSGSQAFAETFQELIDNKATLTNPRWVPSFDASLQDGTLIGNIGAAWEAPLFKDSAGDTGKGDWRVTQIGDWFGNGTSTGPDGGSGVAVLKGCEHKAEAMEFLDWFNTQVEDLTSQGLIVAANTETAKTPESWNEFYGGQDVMKEFATANDNMVAFNYMPGYSAVSAAMQEAADKAADGSGKVADVFPVAQQTSIDTLKNYGLSVAK